MKPQPHLTVVKTSTTSVISNIELAEIAQRIRCRVRRLTSDVIEIGAELIVVKAGLPHGQFQKWVADSLGMSVRSATNYMALADMVQGKSEIVADLPLHTLYRLASPSTPAEFRARVIEDVEAGREIDPRKIDSWIRGEQVIAQRKKAPRLAALRRTQRAAALKTAPTSQSTTAPSPAPTPLPTQESALQRAWCEATLEDQAAFLNFLKKACRV